MKDDETEFIIPDNFIQKLYEFSGAADTYKGFILALCNENGEPVVYCKYGSVIVEMGLKKSLIDLLKNTQEEDE
jgi:hypothetical protein